METSSTELLFIRARVLPEKEVASAFVLPPESHLDNRPSL